MLGQEKRDRFANELKADGQASTRNGEIIAATFAPSAADVIGEPRTVDPSEFDGVDFAYIVVRNNYSGGRIAWSTPIALTTERLDALRLIRALGRGHALYDLKTGDEA